MSASFAFGLNVPRPTPSSESPKTALPPPLNLPLWTAFDVKVIDGAVNGLARLWGWAGTSLRPVQTGRVQNYAFSIFAGMLVLVVVLAWIWVS
jgi:hypothetical protein